MDALKRHTNGGKVNKYHSAIELIGCSIDAYKQHLEQGFKHDMTWENHGPIWHIDHIKSCQYFDLSKPEEQEKCFHFSNMQPLWSTTEIAKKFNDFNILFQKHLEQV